jgi:ribonuclease VapC
LIAVDTSALVAILFDEPEQRAFLEAIDIDQAHVSAASILELHMVAAGRYGGKRMNGVDPLIQQAGLIVEPVTLGQLHLARGAFDRFGKGRGSPAQLNFGDCFAYALARSLDAPLLYKGGDFALTDVKTALA